MPTVWKAGVGVIYIPEYTGILCIGCGKEWVEIADWPAAREQLRQMSIGHTPHLIELRSPDHPEYYAGADSEIPASRICWECRHDSTVAERIHNNILGKRSGRSLSFIESGPGWESLACRKGGE